MKKWIWIGLDWIGLEKKIESWIEKGNCGRKWNRKGKRKLEKWKEVEDWWQEIRRTGGDEKRVVGNGKKKEMGKRRKNGNEKKKKKRNEREKSEK